MKLTILGAASPRFPLLLHSLLQRPHLKITTIALFDTDKKKLHLLHDTLLNALVNHHNSKVMIILAETLEEAIKDSDYIFSSIRVGGQARRAQDEQLAISFGQIAQETVGIGGFSLAMRTVPKVLEQVRCIQSFAPNAVLINFTNPSGLITQAVYSLTGFSKIVGICDAPQLITTHVASIYGCDEVDVQIKYYGLNHLGWVYSIQVRGEEKIKSFINEHLEEFCNIEPFYKDMVSHIRRTGFIPNEYLYYYLQKEKVEQLQRKAPKLRAQQIELLDEELYQKLEQHTVSPLEAFNHYMSARNGSYMSTESGHQRNITHFDLLSQKQANGYDAIALDVLECLIEGSNKQLILNIPNAGFDPNLDDEDIIEVTSQLNGKWFAAVGKAPDIDQECLSLLYEMKRYERAVIKALEEKSEQSIIQALSLHPFVDQIDASIIVKALQKDGSFL